MRITASARSGVAGVEGRDEAAVAHERLLPLAFVVPEDAAERARDAGRGAHRVEQARAAGGLEDDPVERLVGGHVVLGFAQGVERLDVLLADARRGQRGGARFQQRAQLVEVEQVVAVEAADDRAAVGLHVDQALRLELQERLADRRAGRAEALRERLRPQPLARLQVPFEDRLLEQIAHPRCRHLAYEITAGRLAQAQTGPLCMQSVVDARAGVVPARVASRAAEPGSGSGSATGAASSRLCRTADRECEPRHQRAGSAATSGPARPPLLAVGTRLLCVAPRTPPSSSGRGRSTPPAAGAIALAAAGGTHRRPCRPRRLVGARLGRERVGGRRDRGGRDGAGRDGRCTRRGSRASAAGAGRWSRAARRA